MSPTFQAHLEILPEAQWRLWPELRPTLQLGLVLYGGTAIVLRLGHRSSVDFGFFTDQPLDRIAIHTAFPFLDRSQVLQDQPDTFTVVVPGGDSHDHPIKVSFFGALGFGRVGEPEGTHDRVLQVASPDDLMAAAIERRHLKGFRVFEEVYGPAALYCGVVVCRTDQPYPLTEHGRIMALPLGGLQGLRQWIAEQIAA